MLPSVSKLGYAVPMAALDELHLLNLTVAPALQGRGHGNALMDVVMAHGRGSRFRTVWLEVRQSNLGAQRLYAQRGFAPVGQRPGYYPAHAGQREDAVVMSIALRHDGLD